jgi:pilus assembly protein TadC
VSGRRSPGGSSGLPYAGGQHRAKKKHTHTKTDGQKYSVRKCENSKKKIEGKKKKKEAKQNLEVNTKRVLTKMTATPIALTRSPARRLRGRNWTNGAVIALSTELGCSVATANLSIFAYNISNISSGSASRYRDPAVGATTGVFGTSIIAKHTWQLKNNKK